MRDPSGNAVLLRPPVVDLPAVNCILTPETDEGPYWVDERLRRADIVEGQAGVPLTLQVCVFENSSEPRPCVGAGVDVWQANALGLYSDEPDQPRGNTAGLTFLRGCQFTGADGAVRFKTIYPGWYEGRTLHLHLRVRSFHDDQPPSTFTTQIFFDEESNDAVLATSPYNERPGRDTTNAEDGIFVPGLIADLEGDEGRGYHARFRVCLSSE